MKAALGLTGTLAVAAGAFFLLRSSGGVDDSPAQAPREVERPVEELFGERRSVVEPVPGAETSGGLGGPGGRGGPGDPAEADILRNNEATRWLADGEYTRAIQVFEDLLRSYPEHELFRHNLAESLIGLAITESRERELAAAIEHMERALEVRPESDNADGLREYLRRWRAETEEEVDHWTEDSDLFVLSYSTERDDILYDSQSVLDHLETTYEELRGWFGVDPVRELGRDKVRVVLYRKAAFSRLTGLGDWAGGAFDGVVRVAVEDLGVEESRWRRVLRHELVHVYIHEIGGRGVPGWLNEGLAQHLEGELSVADASRRLGSELFALERLQGSLAAWTDSEAIGRAYAQSLLMTDVIEREYGAEALRRMVAGCADGADVAVTFEAYTAVPLNFVLELVARR